MSTEVARHHVLLTARTDQFVRDMTGAQRHFHNVGRTMTTIGRNLARKVTLPIIGVGIAAGKLGMDFETEMQKIVGLVGESQGQVDEWANAILELAPKLGRAPRELAEALYFITSAGIEGAEAMEVLEMSGKAAAAGLGETMVVADLVSSAINAYGKENITAAEATDILVAAVREGKADASEFAGVLGGVLPIAAEMGVTFNETAAAVAAMTRTGTDAATATTQLKNIMIGLLRPSKQAEDALNEMGITSAELREQMGEEGLLPVLMRLKDATNEYGEDLMAQVFPNIRSLMGVLDLMGENMEDNVKIFGELEDATGSLEHAFETVEDTAQHKLNVAIAEMQAGLIELWDVMKDSVIPIIEDLAGGIRNLTEWFRDLDEEQQQNIIRWAGWIAAAGPALWVIGGLAGAISKLIGLFATMGKGAAIAAGKIGLIKGASKVATTAVASDMMAVAGVKGFGGATVAAGGFGAKLLGLAKVGGPIGIFMAAVGAMGYHTIQETKAMRDSMSDTARGMEREVGAAGRRAMTSLQAALVQKEGVERAIMGIVDAASIGAAELERKLADAGYESVEALAQALKDGELTVEEAVAMLVDGVEVEEPLVRKFGSASKQAIMQIADGIADGRFTVQEALEQMIDYVDPDRLPYILAQSGYDGIEELAEAIQSGEVTIQEAIDILFGQMDTGELNQLLKDAGYTSVSDLADAISDPERGLTVTGAFNVLVGHLNTDELNKVMSHTGYESMEAMAQAIERGDLTVQQALNLIIRGLDKTAEARAAGTRTGDAWGRGAESAISRWIRILDRRIAAWLGSVQRDLSSVDPGAGTIGGGFVGFHTGGVFRAPRLGGEGLALLKDRERIIPAGLDKGTQPEQRITNQYTVNLNVDNFFGTDRDYVKLERRLKEVRFAEAQRGAG